MQSRVYAGELNLGNLTTKSFLHCSVIMYSMGKNYVAKSHYADK